MKSKLIIASVLISSVLISCMTAAPTKDGLTELLNMHCPKACDGSAAFEFLLKHCSCPKSKGKFRFGKRDSGIIDNALYRLLWQNRGDI